LDGQSVVTEPENSDGKSERKEILVSQAEFELAID
jgi:hypothetical protein